MPAKSRKQQKMIYTKRSIYKTKAKTPDKWKWIWDPGYSKIEEESVFDKYLNSISEGRDLMSAVRGGALMNVGAGSMQQIIDVIKALYDRGMTAQDIAEALLSLLGVDEPKWIEILTSELEQVTEAMSGKNPAKLKKLMAFFNDSYLLISKYISGNGPSREEVEALMDKYPEFDKHFTDPDAREQYIKLFTIRTMDFGDYKAGRNMARGSKQRAIEAPKSEPMQMGRKSREKVRVSRKNTMEEDVNMSHFKEYINRAIEEESKEGPAYDAQGKQTDGEGREVLLTNDENTDIDMLAKKHLKDKKNPTAQIKAFIADAKRLGYSPEDILDGIKNEWKADTNDLLDKYQVELGLHEKEKKNENK
jgi:hypothetical protein